MTHVETLMWIREATDRDLATIALRLLASDPREFETLVQEHKRLLALKDKDRRDDEERMNYPMELMEFYVPRLGFVHVTQREINQLAEVYTDSSQWVATIKFALNNIFNECERALATAKWTCEYFRDNGNIPDHRESHEHDDAFEGWR